MRTVDEVSMVTAIEDDLEIVIETSIEAVIEVSMKLSLKLPCKTPLRLSWGLLFSLRSIVEIAVEVAMETAPEAAMDTALGTAMEKVEYVSCSLCSVVQCVRIVPIPRVVCVSLRSAVLAHFWPVSLASQFVKRSFHLTLRLFV